MRTFTYDFLKLAYLLVMSEIVRRTNRKSKGKSVVREPLVLSSIDDDEVIEIPDAENVESNSLPIPSIWPRGNVEN